MNFSVIIKTGRTRQNSEETEKTKYSTKQNMLTVKPAKLRINGLAEKAWWNGPQIGNYIVTCGMISTWYTNTDVLAQYADVALRYREK